MNYFGEMTQSFLRIRTEPISTRQVPALLGYIKVIQVIPALALIAYSLSRTLDLCSTHLYAGFLPSKFLSDRPWRLDADLVEGSHV